MNDTEASTPNNAQAGYRDPHRGGDSYEASMLRNLLARIHRDGGHYVEKHGLDKALDDAEAKVVQWLVVQEADPAAAKIAALEAEIERLKAARGRFAGWFSEMPSGMTYRLWEQCGHEPSAGGVALYEG